MISAKQAQRIAAQWHSPSPLDHEMTALSHGRKWDKIGLLGEIDREIKHVKGNPHLFDADAIEDLNKLRKWVAAQ